MDIPGQINISLLTPIAGSMFPKIEAVCRLENGWNTVSNEYILTGDPCFPFDESLEVARAILLELTYVNGISVGSFDISEYDFKSDLIDLIVTGSRKQISVVLKKNV